MTLNGLAYQYVTALEQWPVLPYLLLLPGFVVGLVLPAPRQYIARGPHWLAVLGIGLVITLQQLVWFAMPAAVLADRFWLLAAADIVVVSLAGLVLARLGKARSRDAYGHAGWAFLQAVPILNLPLLLARSRVDAVETPRLLSSWDLPAAAVAVVGITLIALTRGMTSYLEFEVERIVAKASEGQAFLDNFVRYQIEAEGLPAVVAETAAAIEPQEIEPGHRLLRAEADGAVLHVYHQLDEPEAEELTSDYRRALVSDTCHGLAWLLNAGGTVSRHFSRTPDRLEFEVLDIRNEDCFV